MLSALRFLALLFVLSLIVTAGAFAQTSHGSIAGSVADKSGSMVPEADVKIEQKATGLTRSMSTTSAGNFSFPDLPAGLYTVTVTRVGFRTLKTEDVEV